MSFYCASPSNLLRQGDIVSGLPILHPTLQGASASDALKGYKIEVKVCPCAVITPCCSIEDEQVVLSPLHQLESRFIKNEFFRADPLMINCKVEPEQSTGARAWEGLLPDEKVKRLAEGKAFAWLYLFVFDAHPLLQTYTLKGKETGFYCVDFRRTFAIKWDQIRRGNDAASGIKLLELGVEARATFREKLTAYFERTPEEDRAQLAAMA